jgi:hypothetical protein
LCLRSSRHAATLWITTYEFCRVHFRNAGNRCSKITESFSYEFRIIVALHKVLQLDGVRQMRLNTA